MKTWLLSVRIALVVGAYVISLILLMNTSAFIDGSFKASFITVNVIAAFVIGIGYAGSGNALSPAYFVCIGLCIPSLMAYSKLGDMIFDISSTNKIPAFFTGVLFLIVVIMFQIAKKLKKLELEYNTFVSGEANEEEIKIVMVNSLKIYLAFIAVVFSLVFILITFGFVILNVKGSTPIAVLTAIAGIALFTGCMIYIYRMWSKQAGS